MVEPLLKPLRRQVLVCTVTGGLNTNNYTVPVQPDDGGPAFDATLNLTVRNSYGLCIVPVNGSKVEVTRPALFKGMAYISKVNDAQKVLIKIGSQTAEWDAQTGVLTLNGGNNGGVPMAPQVVQRLNLLEHDLMVIKAVFAAWVPVPGDGGLVLKTATTTWAATPLVDTTLADIANPKIKQ